MKLSEAIESYVALQRSLEKKFKTEAIILKAFTRSVGDIALNAVTLDSVIVFLNGHHRAGNYWHRKFSALKGFYRFAVGRAYVAASPLPTATPQRSIPIPPFIYSREQIRLLLKSTNQHAGKSILDSDTFRNLLLLLFGTGFRLGEALRLRLQDVDFENDVLTVNESKFFKSSLVPMSHRLSEELIKYAERRKKNSVPVSMERILLCSAQIQEPHFQLTRLNEGFENFANQLVLFERALLAGSLDSMTRGILSPPIGYCLGIEKEKMCSVSCLTYPPTLDT